MPRLIEIIKDCEKTVIHTDCGAKIGYYLNEVKSYIKEDYGGGKDTVYYIICPNCGQKVVVNGY
jgi:DNA-directed RNA polymerase subunit RPC12/RpoP